MEDKIRAELFELEREKPIHLVNARERGSRMLGVSHDDSDYDVLFLFAQDAAQYAKLDGRVDSIHDPQRGEDGLIDLHGWNIDKFAQLAADSNPNAVEYCRPDANEYITFHGGGTFDAIEYELQQNFNHMALYHHHISMAKSNYKKCVESGNDCTKGRQFYVARAIGCAHYIRTVGELPPMNAIELADELHETHDNLASTLGYLSVEKINGRGTNEHDDVVGRFYTEESDADMDPTDERICQPDRETIDAFIERAVVR